MLYNERRATVTLEKPVRVSDGGNDVAVTSMSGDVQFGGGYLVFQPDMHQFRDGLNRLAPERGDLFSIAVEQDAELNALMMTARERLAVIIAERLADING